MAIGASRRKTLSNAGRPPTPYDPQVAALVLEELAKGQRSLRSICRDNDFPGRDVIYGWVLDFPEFATQFIRARELQIHGYADDIIEIADDREIGEFRAKVMIDARKWIAGKLMPKVYGEHIQVDQNTTITDDRLTDVMRKLTPEERSAIRTILTAASEREEPSQSEPSGVVPANRRIGR